ncbi:glucosaminidase domain-containing protein [Akkermansia muciniphila]|uniref:glucosaminidase domain-containing protein n=1 Tax=Akkermansia muciniphila TaxID=239935 RepID=UPI00201DD947|nr:glucosaminidase domain-containing protein [Akkermansia muciniphila]MCL6677138.1 glucosaminidase domain-containing protein [Akkermansia muciniphila]
MREFPLYGGPSLQTAKADPGVAARAANGDQGQVLGASVQKAEEAVQGSAEAFARISDFGEMQRQEVELRRIRDESDAKFSKMLAFAPGTKESIFEKDGSIRQGKLDDLAYEFGQKIDALGGSFFHPESAMKAEAVRASVRSSLPERYWGLAAKHQLGVARQAFDTSLKLAEEKQDWGGYERSVDDAVASGTISRDEGELRLLRGRKKASRHHFENLAATNPDLAADMINRGELDGYFSAAEQDEMMRSLRRQDDNRLTEVVEQTASRPKSKNDRQAVTNALLSGPVYQEELGFHAVYERDGDYSACAPQIDSFIYRVADMVRAGEEGPDLASKKENVILLCKRYAKSAEFQKDVLNRMDKWAKRKEKYKMLNVSERMKEMDGAPLYRQADYNNVIGTLDAEAKNAWQLYADSSKGSDTPKDSEDTWIKRFKKEKIENLQKNLAAKTEIAVRDDFEAWFDGEVQGNGKEPSYVLQEDMLQTILRKVTGRNDLVIPSRGRLMDEYQQTASEKWRDRDSERFNAGPKLLSEGEKQTLRRKDMLRKPFTFPAMVSVDTVNTNAPAGILLPESMRQRFGDDVSGLAALVPSSSSSRRGKPLPVVGYTRGSSPQLTLSGASKLRMTFSSKMDTNVTISPASPEMREFFKREYPGSQDWKQDAGESRVPAAKLGGLGQYSQAFYDAGRKYGVDPKLLMAIAMHETGKGTSAAFLRKNNAMGISPNGGGPRTFSSVEESINYAARLLRKHYLDQGLTTIAAIGGKYAPAGAGNDPRGLNKHWVSGVSKYYKSF